jgi:hypothetical protein
MRDKSGPQRAWRLTVSLADSNPRRRDHERIALRATVPTVRPQSHSPYAGARALSSVRTRAMNSRQSAATATQWP